MTQHEQHVFDILATAVIAVAVVAGMVLALL
jgi:hypothetical protein